MSFYGTVFRIAVTIVRSPIFAQVWRHYTGKPLTAKAVFEEVSRTRTFQNLQAHAEKGAKSVVDAYKFDPKNPQHYKPQNKEDYDPLATKLKAIKTGFAAAKDALHAEHKGANYQPTYPINPAHYNPQPAKPITKTNRMINDV
jgi:hypothetical protein